MGTFEPSSGWETEVRDAVRDQVRELCEQIASDAAGNLVFPAEKSGPILVFETEKGFAVSNVGPMGHMDEWGTVNNPPYAPLRRAVEASGLEFDEI